MTATADGCAWSTRPQHSNPSLAPPSPAAKGVPQQVAPAPDTRALGPTAASKLAVVTRGGAHTQKNKESHTANTNRIPSSYFSVINSLGSSLDSTKVGGKDPSLISVDFNDSNAFQKIKDILGKDFSDAMATKKEFKKVYAIKTSNGVLNVNASFRPKYNDIFFTLSDTQTTGTSLRLDLSDQDQPTKLTRIDDPSNVFSGIFRDWKMNMLSTVLGTIDEQSYKQRIQKAIDYVSVTNEIRSVQSKPDRSTMISDDYVGGDNGIFVNQNYYQVAPIDVPLATAGVNTCSALVVVDPEGKKHYLAHIDSSASSDQIANSIKANFEAVGRLKIFVMEGLTPSGTVQNIYSAMKKLGIEKKLNFVNPKQGSMFPQIATQNSSLLNPTVQFSKKADKRVN